MALSGSKVLTLGSEIPDIRLPDTNGGVAGSAYGSASRVLLVVFMRSHSPDVEHAREVLLKLIWEYQQKGVAAVAINSPHPEHSAQETPESMAAEARRFGYTFPYLLDRSQDVAKCFGSIEVPDFFVFDKMGKLAYHGRMDDSAPRNGRPVTGFNLRNALNTVLENQAPAEFS